MMEHTKKFGLRQVLALCLIIWFMLGYATIPAYAAEETKSHIVENPISGDLNWGETLTNVVDIAPLKWSTRYSEREEETVYYVTAGAKLTYGKNIYIRSSDWSIKGTSGLFESQESNERLRYYEKTGDNTDITFTAPGLYSVYMFEAPEGVKNNDEMPEPGDHPEWFRGGYIYVGNWENIQPKDGALIVNKYTTIAANVLLSDCISTINQTLISRKADGSTSEKNVTIQNVAQQSTCTIFPADGSTQRLFILLSEYKLTDGVLDSTGCFKSVQLVADGGIQLQTSPGGQKAPTAENPATLIFGKNSEAKIVGEFSDGTKPNGFNLKPGYLYCISVGGEMDWFGEQVWISISDSKIASPEISSNNHATPTSSRVLINGKEISFDAYEISGNNYFKLRDIANVLSGTGKQFEVTWDGDKNAINLLSGKAYTAVGGELAKSDGNSNTATLNTSKVYLDGKEISLTAYTINDNNYFKLRDLGQIFNFGVGWDGAGNTVTIDTSIGYTVE